MTGIWQDPIRAMTTVGEEQVLIYGVVSETYGQDGVYGTSYKFLIQETNGWFKLVDVDGVIGNWRYTTIPDGERAGQLGWYDITPDTEVTENPIDGDFEDG